MRRTVIVFITFIIFLGAAIYGAVYVKGILHFPAYYDGGVMAPEEDVVNEWWIAKNKVSFLTTRWRFILDQEKKHLMAVNLPTKSYVKVSLPMNLLSHVDQQLGEALNQYQINGLMKKTGQKRNLLQKSCEEYSVSEWIIFQDQRFYVRERILAVSENVPFDWKLVNELYSWIRSFFKPEQAYLEGMKNIPGFIFASEDVRFQEGDEIKYKFEVTEIKENQPVGVNFAIPKDFKEKNKFTRQELIDIRTTIYYYYR